jgi:hypothetical protein
MAFDLAVLAGIGVGLLGLCLVGLEWLAKRLVRRSNVLPPPSEAAERKVYRWREDTE